MATHEAQWPLIVFIVWVVLLAVRRLAKDFYAQAIAWFVSAQVGFFTLGQATNGVPRPWTVLVTVALSMMMLAACVMYAIKKQPLSAFLSLQAVCWGGVSAASLAAQSTAPRIVAAWARWIELGFFCAALAFAVAAIAYYLRTRIVQGNSKRH